MEETWKPINGFVGLYEVSNQGRVRGLDRLGKSKKRMLRGQILRPGLGSHGYPTVSLFSADGERYWATAASQSLTYVSLGDARGYLPRPVQYDQPGSMDPAQLAALTFGPAADRSDECGTHDYMRRHTRLLLLVRP